VTPRIDIAIPCYNYGAYLGPCLDSVLSQSVRAVRVLVVDNASTDDSLAVARRRAARDARIEVLARPVNLGPHASFNAGVDWASSDYFMILCADDLLAPGALRGAMDALDAAPEAAFAIGEDVEWIAGAACPGTGRPPRAQDWRQRPGTSFLRQRCREPMRNLAAGAVLVRTAVQKAAGHYRRELAYCDDHEMLLRLAAMGDVLETACILGVRRIHASNMSQQFNAGRIEELRHRHAAFTSFLAHEGAARPDAPELRRLADRGFAAQAFRWGLRALLGGHVTAAGGLFAWAAARDPAIVVRPPLGDLLRRPRRSREQVDALGAAWTARLRGSDARRQPPVASRSGGPVAD
jgi:GT2 family glycosyltransferase